MKKLNYCTCGLNTKHTFSGIFIIFGILLNIFGIFLVIIVPFMIWFLIAAILLQVWYGIDYYHQALYLKHTKPCAKRYAIIAATSQSGSFYYMHNYGYLSGYKSTGYRILKKIRLSAKLIDKIMIIGLIWLITAVIAGLTYMVLSGNIEYAFWDVPPHFNKPFDIIFDWISSSAMLTSAIIGLLLGIKITKRIKKYRTAIRILVLPLSSLAIIFTYAFTYMLYLIILIFALPFFDAS